MVKNKANFIIIIILTVLLLLSIIGKKMFPQRRELSETKLITVVGYDKEEEGYTLTFLESGGESSGSGTQSNKEETEEQVIKIYSHSYNYDIRLVQTLTDKYLSIAHIEYYFIGEETAKEDLHHVIDKIAGGYQSRLDAKVYIIKGMSAQEFLNEIAKSKYKVMEKLKNMENNIISSGGVSDVTLIDIGKMFLSHNGSGVIPVLKLVESKSDVKEIEVKSTDENKNITNFVFDFGGLGIIDDMKLIDFLDEKETIKLNYISGPEIITEQTINIEDDGMISFGISEIESKVSFGFDSNSMLNKIKVKTTFNANYEEINAKTPVFSQAKIREFEEKLELKIKKDITEIITLSQKMQTDFINLEDILKRNNPYKYRKIKDNYIEMFKNASIEVETDCNIQTSYYIIESNWKQGGE